MSYEIEYIQAKSGEPIVKVNSYLLHSKYDPIKEAQRICQKEYTENYVHIVFGYGMGYIVEELKKSMKNEEAIIVVDPLKDELNIIDEKVVSTKDISIFKEQLENTLEHYSREVKVICSPNYEKIAMESYKSILQIVKDIQMSNVVYDNTIQLWSEKWQENSIHNLTLLAKDQPLTALYELTNKPIIIASGGPSLNKQLPLLNDIRDNIILIAAGSTINSLIKNEIIPDYVVSIDGGEANYKHFKDVESNGTRLIYGVSSHYKIQQEWKNERFIFAGIEDRDLQHKVKKKYKVDLPLVAGGGSVANYCYSIAAKMTTGPIAFIGQDLAYTNLQSHALGNRASKGLTKEYLLKRNAFITTDYQGKEVYSDYAFYSMKESFEHLARNNPHQPGVYNCTEGGIPMKGIENYPFRKFINEFIIPENTYIHEINSFPQVNWQDIRSELTNETKLYSVLEEACFNLVLNIKRDFHKKYFSPETLKKLKRTDAQLKEIIENELMIQSIMEPLIKQVLTKYKGNSQESEIAKFERVYQQNITWYGGLQEIMKKMSKFTKSAIKLGDESICKN
ncbi:motility associated factor glycosyltransferase family protein [Lysinibacillus sp. 3P01SB]|uniref:motility associated factor glycosyltransferase family protein n=1 Tax=Lysinibacillus sp. 3P01SB TaxID=3132284 RepID=UPI0039A5DB08